MIEVEESKMRLLEAKARQYDRIAERMTQADRSPQIDFESLSDTLGDIRDLLLPEDVA